MVRRLSGGASRHLGHWQYGGEVNLHRSRRADEGQDGEPPFPQFGLGLLHRPRIQPAVLEQGEQGVFVGAEIRVCPTFYTDFWHDFESLSLIF